MNYLIENNLLVQIPIVLLCALIFMIILEGFGFITIRTINLLTKRAGLSQYEYPSTIVENMFIGGVTYALLFLLIGSLGLITKISVVLISISVPLFLFVFYKRWNTYEDIKIRKNLPLILGAVLFLILTFALWFRPVTNFDGLWYHITIPKLFLQRHSTESLGSMISYSVQPTITYFWNLWPLSVPVSTAISGIVINTIGVMMFTVALVYAAIIGRKTFNWGPIEQIATILVLGTTYEALRLLGTGGNDLIGVSYGLVAALSIFYLQHKKETDWNKFIVSLLLVVGLASTKVFFLIFAAVLVAYLVVGCWDKFMPLAKLKRLRIMFVILAATFILTFLPWLIRSYLETGKILYPIGVAGFSESVLRSEGGGTPVNHWTKFIFERFYTSLWPMITFVYSPIVGVGMAGIVSSKFRKNLSNLWIVALFGLLAVYFASVALQWRYYLPPAILLIYLGLVIIFRFVQDRDLFGKFAIIVGGILLITLSLYRVTFSTSDTSGIPSINGDLYVSNFSGANKYIDTKLSVGTYDYVQQVSPADLRRDENIFIGNSYVKPLPIYGMMKLAYVDNPILEHTIDADKFSNVDNVDSFVRVLEGNNVRYILTHDKMTDVCKIIGIKNYKSCDNALIFEPVFYDNKWDVNWFRVKTPGNSN